MQGILCAAPIRQPCPAKRDREVNQLRFRRATDHSAADEAWFIDRTNSR